jgi:hypothetical protein
MKNLIRFSLLLLGALVFTCGLAQAQSLPLDASGHVIVAAAAIPFYATTEFWTALFGLISALVAICKNSALKDHQKVNQALVLTIEAASKLPEIVAAEQRFKGMIAAKAEQLGVQPLLDRIVQDLTITTPAPATARAASDPS